MQSYGVISRVKESRKLTAAHFPLPSVDDCIDYAICEAAEALDALLRQRRPGDLRNNERNVDFWHEWGQCGYMIASALMQLPHEFSHHDLRYANSTIYSTIYYLSYEGFKTSLRLALALESWWKYCQQEGQYGDRIVGMACEKFEEKYHD